jgi:hypothetical protein
VIECKGLGQIMTYFVKWEGLSFKKTSF